MFTNNYINFRKRAFLGQSGSYVVASGGSKTGYQHSFSEYDIGQHMGTGRCRSILTTSVTNSDSSYVYPGVYFGTGSTAATKNDYTLESPITSGLTITNPYALVWQNNGNGKYAVCADFILRNTTEAEINIYEIGVFSAINSYNYGNEGNSSNIWWLTLMERTVLTEPITIAPGESKLVTYKITFNQTLNVE